MPAHFCRLGQAHQGKYAGGNIAEGAIGSQFELPVTHIDEGDRAIGV